MGFNPVSDRSNFTTTADEAYYKQQGEERHASENDGFCEVLEEEMGKLERCDVLVTISPLWWFSVPAILKGWFDRVLAAGRMYGGGKWYDNGVLKGKKAIASITTGGPSTMYSEAGLNGHMDAILFPLHHGVFWFCGAQPVQPHVTYSAAHIGDEARSASLDQWEEALLNINDRPIIQYHGLADYDDSFILKSDASSSSSNTTEPSTATE